MEENKNTGVSLRNFETSTELAEVKVIYKTKRKGTVKILSSCDAFNVL